jgi:hypothetical protein
MKRDLDLVRKILLHFEEKANDSMEQCPIIEGYEAAEIRYHLILMNEAGLLRCEQVLSTSTPSRVIRVYPFSLTWQGHEFLSAAKNDSLWLRAKGIAVDKAGILSFELVKSILVHLAKTGAGL